MPLPTLSSYGDSFLSRSDEVGPPSGHLSKELGAYGHQETLGNSDAYPCRDGAFYGFDTGAADEDLLQSDDAHTVDFGSTSYNSAGGVVDFGEEAMSQQSRDRASGFGQHYYKNAVPVVIPWALLPLPDM
ncbi:uncharacterized protein MAM_01981 [Metarhizium album ARSEF 1941]|uniref:Uncharacterized protein n=1 Tax=Metarhizium album (strain ARSEF 1941) TaxID=1081103 RepID=A0A0B2X2T1_METAS|nr:uncharacterized protein MAM_01981 [Metarhizium album ARSEF 1941]KHO00058.1 hypothetical protein MAM_01981 [Metarhizium album ARSEF 1941]